MSASADQPTPQARGRGRPVTSSGFRIVPVRHQHPDPRALGRAFLALALHNAQSTPTADTSDESDTAAEQEGEDEPA